MTEREAQLQRLPRPDPGMEPGIYKIRFRYEGDGSIPDERGIMTRWLDISEDEFSRIEAILTGGER